MNKLAQRLKGLSKGSRIYKLRVLPEILARASQADRLYTVLSDFDFIEFKLQELGLYELVQDYDCALIPAVTDSPEYNEDKSIDLRVIKNTLLASWDILQADTTQVKEQLLLRLQPFKATDRPLIGKLLEQLAGDR